MSGPAWPERCSDVGRYKFIGGSLFESWALEVRDGVYRKLDMVFVGIDGLVQLASRSLV